MKKIATITTCALLLGSCTQGNINKTKQIEASKTSTSATLWNTTTNTWTTTLQTNSWTTMAKKESMQTSALQNGDIVASMKTTNGTMKIKLFQKEVPHTVNNFIGLAQDKYYDGIIFHRVIKGFMIQGGDPTGTGMWGESIYWEKFSDEFSKKLTNIPYSVSMANSGKDTNGSQFFINQAPNNFLDNKHSVFWQVIEWMENVDKIAKTKVADQDKPVKDIKIISIDIQKYNNWKLENYTLDKKEAIADYNKAQKNKEDENKKNQEAKKSKKLATGDTVSVHYTLTVDGEKKDSSLDRGQPFEFTLGAKQVIAGWDKGLIGHKIWDKFKLEVQPEDGYWVYDEKKIQVVPREQLADFEKNGIELKVGNKLPTQYWEFEIKKATDKEITLDVNHALADKVLNFDIEVVDIK